MDLKRERLKKEEYIEELKFGNEELGIENKEKIKSSINILEEDDEGDKIRDEVDEDCMEEIEEGDEELDIEDVEGII